MKTFFQLKARTTEILSTHQKLLIENITKEYKKSDSSIVTKVDKKAKVIAKSINMDHKIEMFARNNAFIPFKTLKTTYNAD